MCEESIMEYAVKISSNYLEVFVSYDFYKNDYCHRRLWCPALYKSYT